MNGGNEEVDAHHNGANEEASFDDIRRVSFDFILIERESTIITRGDTPCIVKTTFETKGMSTDEGNQEEEDGERRTREKGKMKRQRDTQERRTEEKKTRALREKIEKRKRGREEQEERER
ncbi:hypothetical protein Tco_0962148 [Tanacetum coccineum]